MAKGGSLHNWFKGSKSKGGKPGWVQADGSPCANEPGETKTPKCFSSKRLAALKAKGKKGESLIRSAVRRKREKDPGQQEKSGASKPTNVATFAKGRKNKNYVKPEPGLKEMKENYKQRLATIATKKGREKVEKAKQGKPDAGKFEKLGSKIGAGVGAVGGAAIPDGPLMVAGEIAGGYAGAKLGGKLGRLVDKAREKKKMKEEYLDEAERDIKGKGSGKKDACYHKVKARYDVWPSAYASGALVKCRKKGAANWGNSTKKEQVEVNENMGMMRYCPACERVETRDQCNQSPRFWDTFSVPANIGPRLTENQLKFNIATVHPANEEKDHEYEMATRELTTAQKAAKKIKKMAKGKEGNLPAWVQSKITRGANMIDAASDYLDAHDGDMSEGQKCWKGYEKKGTKKMFGKTYNNCVKKEGYAPGDIDQKVGAVTSIPKDEREAAKERLLAKAKAKREKMSEEKNVHGEIEIPHGDIKKLATKASKRIDTDVDGDVENNDKNKGEYGEFVPTGGNPLKVKGRTFSGGSSKSYSGVKQAESYSWRNDNELMEEILSLYEDKTPAWQRKAGKDKDGGLNRKGIESYRRENPGSKLSMAVTTKPSKLKPGSKAANRRKSFCARMSGMKKKLTSSKTANDPNSRINKSLRKWNC